MSFVKRLGSAVSKTRQGANMTQGELARRSGLHKVAISKIERGIHDDIGCVTLWRIARALGTRGHVLYALAETTVVYGGED